MDMRSFFSNFELNALLFDQSAIDKLEKDFIQDMGDSEEIQLHSFKQRPRWQRASEVIARMLSPLL
ncbi:Cardiolipin synthase [compost metagenome]